MAPQNGINVMEFTYSSDEEPGPGKKKKKKNDNEAIPKNQKLITNFFIK